MFVEKSELTLAQNEIIYTMGLICTIIDFRINYEKFFKEIDEVKTRVRKDYHGVLNTTEQILNARNIKITDEEFNNWFYDADHGFLHSLVCLIWYFKINNIQKHTEIPRHMKNIISILFHDFARIRGDKQHDKNLKTFFNNLSEIAYVHSDPPKKFDSNGLVLSDRIELQRFNYRECVDWIDIEYEKYLDESTNRLQKIYYRHINKPVIYMFSYILDEWIQHGFEKKDLSVIEKYYPNASYKDRLCVENIYLSSIRNQSELFNTSKISHNKYSKLKYTGIIPNKIICKYTNITTTLQRDHLVYESNKIPTSEWVFLYNDDISDSEFYTLNKYSDRVISKKLTESFILCVELFKSRLRILLTSPLGSSQQEQKQKLNNRKISPRKTIIKTNRRYI